MNIKKWQTGALLGMAAVLCVVVFMSFGSKSDGKTTNGEGPVKMSRGKDVKRDARKRRVKGKKSEVARADETKKARERPTFAIDDDDEAKLNAEQRKMIEAIRAALDAEDRPRVLKLVQQLQASDEWPDGIPKSIKLAAIEALGWFGKSCLPEIAGFLGDRDAEVIQAAIEKYEEALSDFDLGDRERATILIEASKVINDADAMESMLFELNNMRHSVAVEALKGLMESGNAATKSVLQESIDFYTGEENLTTPEQLDEWLKQNPDDEDDEEFYGAQKGSGF